MVTMLATMVKRGVVCSGFELRWDFHDDDDDADDVHADDHAAAAGIAAGDG